jgi:hypothetical protein
MLVKGLTVITASVCLLLALPPFLAQATTPTPITVLAACTIPGTGSSETRIGTEGNDVVCELGGNDTIQGGDGNDMLSGGAGRDSLSPEIGYDSINGGGVDSIRSGSGDDTCANDLADRQLDPCTIDVDAPFIDFPSSNGSAIQAGSSAIFHWMASDVSGVVMTWGQVAGRAGWIDWCGFATPVGRIDGTPELGTYELRCEIPANAVNERYTLYVGASDGVGNSLLNLAGFEFTVEVDATD